MKRWRKLTVILGALVVIAGPAFAGMDSPKVPPRGTEGPDIRAKVEPKGIEGPDIRHATMAQPKGVEGPDVR